MIEDSICECGHPRSRHYGLGSESCSVIFPPTKMTNAGHCVCDKFRIRNNRTK